MWQHLPKRTIWEKVSVSTPDGNSTDSSDSSRDASEGNGWQKIKVTDGGLQWLPGMSKRVKMHLL